MANRKIYAEIPPRVEYSLTKKGKSLLPIFKSFVKNAIKKEEARPFKVANNILMMVIDPLTGKKAETESKSSIIEAYKKLPSQKTLNSDINNRLKNNNILRFY